MTNRYQLPLSDEQHQYLLGTVRHDQTKARVYLADLLRRGNEMTSTLDTDIELAEAHLSVATGMVSLLEVLEPTWYCAGSRDARLR